MNSVVASFFRELIQRFGEKSPTFFHVLKISMGFLTLANYIPSIMQRWFNIDMPENLITVCEDLALWSLGVFSGSFLPAKSKPVAITNDGGILTKTDEERLPFTAMKEEKKVQESAIKTGETERVECLTMTEKKK